MKLIAILISLAIERYCGFKISNRFFNLFKQYHAYFDAKFSERDTLGGWGLLALLLLPLILSVWFIQWLTQDWFWGTFAIAFDVFILLICMQSELYEHHLISQDQNVKSETAEQIIVNTTTQLFAVLFWYIALGAAGAVLYRSITWLQDENIKREIIAKVVTITQKALDWIPARLCSLSYTLVGHFTLSFPIWLRLAPAGLDSSDDLLKTTGFNALGIEDPAQLPEDPTQDAVDLINRTLIVWLCVTAILTLTAMVT